MCSWGSTLKQLAAVQTHALVSAVRILPGISSKPGFLIIHLDSVPDRQLVNSQLKQSNVICKFKIRLKNQQERLNNLTYYIFTVGYN